MFFYEFSHQFRNCSSLTYLYFSLALSVLTDYLSAFFIPIFLIKYMINFTIPIAIKYIPNLNSIIYALPPFHVRCHSDKPCGLRTFYFFDIAYHPIHVKKPQFLGTAAFMHVFKLLQLELAVVSCFLNLNSNPPFFKAFTYFCMLRVSYASFFTLFQIHFFNIFIYAIYYKLIQTFI